MKSVKIFAGILLFISFSFTNCSPNRDYLFNTNEIITRGNWGIDFFVSQDKTAQYGNYTFQFFGNGLVQGNNGIDTVKGNWTVIHDVDRSDVLTITMNEQNSISELSNIWNVKAKTAEALKLQLKGSNVEFRIRKL